MNNIQIILQLIVGLGILNVWILRRDQSTAYRGQGAANITQEFAAYGLPSWSVWLIGGLKILSAIALLAGFWLPMLITPAAGLLAVLMLGALAMHLKVSDPLKKSLPALGLLACCVTILLIS